MDKLFLIISILSFIAFFLFAILSIVQFVKKNNKKGIIQLLFAGASFFVTIAAFIVFLIVIPYPGKNTTEEQVSTTADANGELEKAPDQTVEKDQQETKTEPVSTEPKNNGLLTEEKFSKITDGMTYEEVVNIIGSEGTVMSETGTPGSAFHTVMYEFKTDGFMSVSTMTFQGGKLINKTQFGLGSSNTEISLEQFNNLQNGMTTEEVFAILGGEGEIISQSGDIVMYSYTGKTLGANASIMFQGGKLISKSQIGLE